MSRMHVQILNQFNRKSHEYSYRVIGSSCNRIVVNLMIRDFIALFSYALDE